MKGRFAPSPSGRLHLGNMFTALMAWLSTRKQDGQFVLRIEDIDRQRSKQHWADWIMRDMEWLGLDWDEGPFYQSSRTSIYEDALQNLDHQGILYRCHCTRADLTAGNAPHTSDGLRIYDGRCRPIASPPYPSALSPDQSGAIRICVPDIKITFTDARFGLQQFRLVDDCGGDFIVRRSDGQWAYQLAVSVDDALMGITEVMRGEDLLSSSARQIYLQNLLGYSSPIFSHLPLIKNESGQRLSKRDAAEAMDSLRLHFTPEQIIGQLAFMGGLIPEFTAISTRELISL